MNQNTHFMRGPRRAWAPILRTAVAIIVTASLALPVAAFGSSPSSSAAGGLLRTRGSALSQSKTVQEALAFARCMRSHGVRNWPDPNNSGVFAKKTPQQLGVSSTVFQAAQNVCQHLLPNGDLPPGGQPTPAELRKMERDALNFSRCMRSHGVPDWPDYTLRGGIPIFDLHGTSIAPNAPQIVAKQLGCKSQLHLSYSPPTSGGARG
ncbi:MAG TPA: hypothetical protein VGH56_11810 [Solirubrobacteraceae bacterium]|jgi:hypothetical protein